METLTIPRKLISAARLASASMRKNGDAVPVNTITSDQIEPYLVSEHVLSKDWLTPEEDLAWKDL